MGIVLGILFGLIALVFAPGLIGLGAGLAGGIGIFINIIIPAIIFIVGAFIGDRLEDLQKK